MRKNGRRYEPMEVLQDGHDACILVERVEWPTDNTSAGRFVGSRLDANSPGDRPVPLRHTPSALGP
jgi:hypothetical protein